MKRSGYNRCQVKEITESGLVGYERKLDKARKEGREIHREASDTIRTRQKKKLLAKTTWYKKKEKNEKNENRKGRMKGDTRQQCNTTPVVSVLFVPKTEGGELARRLRKEEEIISKITGDKIKIQERSGTMLKRILHKSNPWAKEPCEKPDCLVCMGGEENAGECKRRNVVYRTCCLKCKEKGEGNERYYFGESSRTAYERGKEHLNDFKDMNLDSHMAKHAVVEHQGDTNIKFSMKVMKVHMTAFRRQIHEAVLIQRNQKNCIMNSKGEDNCCSLPRLTVMVGAKEAKVKEKEMREPLTEQEIEEEITKMRSKKRKEIRDTPKSPPKKKRKRWRLELRKDLQQKRKREFSQAEKEREVIEKKRRKIAINENENENQSGRKTKIGINQEEKEKVIQN